MESIGTDFLFKQHEIPQEPEPRFADFQIEDAESKDIVAILNIVRKGERRFIPQFAQELKNEITALYNSKNSDTGDSELFDSFVNPIMEYRTCLLRGVVFPYSKVIYYQGQVAGVIMVSDKFCVRSVMDNQVIKLRDPKGAYIRGLYVDPKYTGENRVGLGRTLMDQMLKDMHHFAPRAKKIYLHVHPQNYNAINAYHAYGFRIISIEKSDAQYLSHVLLMKKEL